MKMTIGQRVKNTYGHQGTVVDVWDNAVTVQPDRHTGTPETWHITKTFPVGR
jgi:preprotein translocase subunit YajC